MRLTRKQVVDAIEAVMAQRCLSVEVKENDAIGCYYAMPNNPSINCVVGKLLTPEQRALADSTEGDTSIDWVNHEHGFFNEEDEPLLADLQWAHDQSKHVKEFKTRAMGVVQSHFGKVITCSN